MNCPHKPKHVVIDSHEGTVICLKCNRVIDINYINNIEECGYQNKSNTIIEEIRVMGENKNFNQNIINTAYIIYNTNMLTLSSKRYDMLHKCAYSLYKASQKLEVHYDLFEMCELFQCDIRILYKIDCLNSTIISPISPSYILERKLSGLMTTKNLSFKQMLELKKLCDAVTPKCKPRTVAACCLELFLDKYALHKKLNITQMDIANTFQIHIRTLTTNLENVKKKLIEKNIF